MYSKDHSPHSSNDVSNTGSIDPIVVYAPQRRGLAKWGILRAKMAGEDRLSISHVEWDTSMTGIEARCGQANSLVGIPAIPNGLHESRFSISSDEAAMRHLEAILH